MALRRRFRFQDAEFMAARSNWFARCVAAGTHLLFSTAVAALAAVLVFWLWYPGVYRQLAGGRSLFLLIALVDVVLGPCLTFAVFSNTKDARQLRRDLAVIGLIQAAALTYGLHTVYKVRPVAMVFEVDRFRLVTASDVSDEELAKGSFEFRVLPTAGPWLLGTRKPRDGEERNDALFKGLEGLDIGYRPLFWQPYEQSAVSARQRSRPLLQLIDHDPRRTTELHRTLSQMNIDPGTHHFLPVIARGDWSAVIDKDGRVVGYLPVDGFF